MIRGRVINKMKGFAIPFVVLAIVVLFVTGVAFLHLGLERRVYSIRTGEDISARCAADAGLWKSSVRSPPGWSFSMALDSSEATVTSTPSLRAASRKSLAR